LTRLPLSQRAEHSSEPTPNLPGPTAPMPTSREHSKKRKGTPVSKSVTKHMKTNMEIGGDAAEISSGPSTSTTSTVSLAGTSTVSSHNTSDGEDIFVVDENGEPVNAVYKLEHAHGDPIQIIGHHPKVQCKDTMKAGKKRKYQVKCHGLKKSVWMMAEELARTHFDMVVKYDCSRRLKLSSDYVSSLYG